MSEQAATPMASGSRRAGACPPPQHAAAGHEGPPYGEWTVDELAERSEAIL